MCSNCIKSDVCSNKYYYEAVNSAIAKITIEAKPNGIYTMSSVYSNFGIGVTVTCSHYKYEGSISNGIV